MNIGMRYIDKKIFSIKLKVPLMLIVFLLSIIFQKCSYTDSLTRALFVYAFLTCISLFADILGGIKRTWLLTFFIIIVFLNLPIPAVVILTIVGLIYVIGLSFDVFICLLNIEMNVDKKKGNHKWDDVRNSQWLPKRYTKISVEESRAFAELQLSGKADQLLEEAENISKNCKAKLYPLSSKGYSDAIELLDSLYKIDQEIINAHNYFKQPVGDNFYGFGAKKFEIADNLFKTIKIVEETANKMIENISIKSTSYNKDNIQRNNSDIASDYFKGCDSLESLKKRYRDLSKVFHPDMGNGSGETFYYIKEEYEKLLKQYK